MTLNQIKFPLVCLLLPFLTYYSPDSRAQNGSCDVLFNLGMYEQALKKCQAEADKGAAGAAFHLSAIFSIYKDSLASTEWLKHAHNLGSIEATYNLAYAYRHGIGVAANSKESIKHYSLASKAGHSQAQYELAELLIRTKEERSHALDWYRESAKQNHILSQIKLAQILLEQGERSLAIVWLKKAQLAGSDNAMYLLGVAYSKTDPASSIAWYKRAIKKGNPYAAHNLARLHMSGKYVEKNYSQALKVVDLAVKAGIPQSIALKKELLKRKKNNAPPNSFLHSREWVFNQPSHLYVLQLGAFRTPDNALSYIKTHQLDKTAFYYPSRHNSKTVFIVLAGPFNTSKEAKKAILRLPASVQASGPFPKSYKRIKQSRSY